MMIPRHRAVVIGGSMAGLFAARVLADHFEQVTILDRDELTESAEFRNGVPQSRHLHQLLLRGQQIMEQLFPTLPADLKAIGAPSLEWGYNAIVATSEGFTYPAHTGLRSNTVSRIALEALIRRRIRELPNVTFLSRHTATGLLTTPDLTTVTGVRAEKRGTREPLDVPADLVVDAGGRQSQAPDWLVALGYERPTRTMVDAHVGYASCWFEKPAWMPPDVAIMLVKAHPQTHRSGMILEVEGGRWTVILTGNNRDYPPSDIEGFLEYARSLQSPLVYNYIRHARPLTQVYGYRNTNSVWNHYEKLDRRPEGFIVTGDAACGFNPVYGQGMSVAAMDAELLGRLLREWSSGPSTGFAGEFQKRLADAVRVPFALATADDLRQPTVEGDVPQQSWFLKQMGIYFRALIDVTDVDPVVFAQFVRVMNLLDAPTTLLRPNMIWRVARYTLSGRRPLRKEAHLGITLMPRVSEGVPD
ncbi:MAG: FAD-dependent monooxygenase [Chloroflexi bacterium]|nr:FAD-dependent monooxygenase [Chloroflexota bacterium]